jgi:hypothetical protein
MQISLRWNDKDVVGPQDQPLRDQFDRHLGESWEDLMEQGVNRP